MTRIDVTRTTSTVTRTTIRIDAERVADLLLGHIRENADGVSWEEDLKDAQVAGIEFVYDNDGGYLEGVVFEFTSTKDV